MQTCCRRSYNAQQGGDRQTSSRSLMHAYSHTYRRKYKQTHTCMHVHKQAYTHTCRQTQICECILSYMLASLYIHTCIGLHLTSITYMNTYRQTDGHRPTYFHCFHTYKHQRWTDIRHACMQAYTRMHAYLHTYTTIYSIHIYIHRAAHLHTYIHTCIHTCIHTYIHYA